MDQSLSDGRLMCWPSLTKPDVGVASWLGLSPRYVRALVKGLVTLGIIEAWRGPEAGREHRQHDGFATIGGMRVQTGRGYQFVMAIPFLDAVALSQTAGVDARGTARRGRLVPDRRALRLPLPQRQEFVALVGDAGVTQYLAWLAQAGGSQGQDATDVFAYHRQRFKEWQEVVRAARAADIDRTEETATRAYIAQRKAKIAAFGQPRGSDAA